MAIGNDEISSATTGSAPTIDDRSPSTGLTNMHRDHRSPQTPDLHTGLLATGMIGLPGVIDGATLCELATVVELDDISAGWPRTELTPSGCRVSLVEVLAHVRLSPDAELLLFQAPEGRSIAARLDELLDPDNLATLIVHSIGDGTSIELRCSAVPSAAVRIVGFEALRFADFVGSPA